MHVLKQHISLDLSPFWCISMYPNTFSYHWFLVLVYCLFSYMSSASVLLWTLFEIIFPVAVAKVMYWKLEEFNQLEASTFSYTVCMSLIWTSIKIPTCMLLILPPYICCTINSKNKEMYFSTGRQPLHEQKKWHFPRTRHFGVETGKN